MCLILFHFIIYYCGRGITFQQIYIKIKHIPFFASATEARIPKSFIFSLYSVICQLLVLVAFDPESLDFKEREDTRGVAVLKQF